MAYSFQTFTANQVFTEGQANQIEVNVRDHEHGRSSVLPSGLNFSQENKTVSFSIGASADGGKLFRAGTGTSSSMNATLPDAATAGNDFAVSILNDNDLQAGETGSVIVLAAGTDIITESELDTWHISPGEVGTFICSNSIWYPYGFCALPVLGQVLDISDSVSSVEMWLPKAYDAVLVTCDLNPTTPGVGGYTITTRREGQASFDSGDTFLLGGTIAASSRHVVALYNLRKLDGASRPFGNRWAGMNGTTPQTALGTDTCGDSSADAIDKISVNMSAGTFDLCRVTMFGLRRALA